MNKRKAASKDREKAYKSLVPRRVLFAFPQMPVVSGINTILFDTPDPVKNVLRLLFIKFINNADMLKHGILHHPPRFPLDPRQFFVQIDGF